MKRLNHLVLWSITVLASVGLAGLFIFPASWEGEQHYVCNLNSEENRYECTLAEEWQYTCNYDNNWWKTRCARWEEQLNFCKNEDLNWENITCYPGYTRSDNINWRYYFTENAQNFSWDSYCEQPEAFESISIQGESMITCDYYWNPAVHYDSCRNDDGSIFCQTKYVPTQDGSVLILHEDPTAESGYAYCDVMPIVSSFGNRVLDSKCYSPNMDPENWIDCFYNENEFICPMEHRCDEWPGGMFCYIEEWGYYCASDEYFYSWEKGVGVVTNKDNSCFPKDWWTEYNNCEYINGMGYFCPTPQSCELDTDWYYCDSKTWWEYSCHPNINTNLESKLAAAEPIGRTFSCEKAWEEPITNCQVKYKAQAQEAESLAVSQIVGWDSYFFCPVDAGSTKYDCDSEDWLAVVCNPATTGNFSCIVPLDREAKNIQEWSVVCSYESTMMDNCYEEYDDYDDERIYVCPIKYNCNEIINWMHVCSLYTEWTAGNDYFYCEDSYTAGGWLKAASMWDYRCEQPRWPQKEYNTCDYLNGKFYCAMKYDCSQVNWWYQCDPKDNGEFNCGRRPMSAPVLALGSSSVSEVESYSCWDNGEAYYSNCTPNTSGYFCPASVELKLYLWGCVNTNTPTAAVVDATIECDGEGYLWTVLVSKDSWVSADTLFNWVNNLPNPEVWMEWVWYLENSQNADKLSESTQFSGDSKLYVFQDKRKIGTIRFDPDWGTDVPSVTGYYNTTIQLPSPTRTWYNFAWWYDGNNKVSISYLIQWDKTLKAHWTENKPSWGYSGWGGSSRPSSKWSWPSTSDVKSVEHGVDTPAKEVKAEPKPVVPWKWANSTGKVNSNQELFDAYKWAYDNGLTKYANMSDARMDDLLNRQEMAKISTIFATKFQWETPNEKKRNDCSQYPDLWKTTKDMQEFIIQSCELGYMWYRANGVDYLERFRPYTPVSVAEVSIILSRIMWQNKYAISENLWYQWHLHAVYENNLLDNITKPFDYIARKDAYVMLYRISKSL